MQEKREWGVLLKGKRGRRVSDKKNYYQLVSPLGMSSQPKS